MWETEISTRKRKDLRGTPYCVPSAHTDPGQDDHLRLLYHFDTVDAYHRSCVSLTWSGTSQMAILILIGLICQTQTVCSLLSWGVFDPIHSLSVPDPTSVPDKEFPDFIGSTSTPKKDQFPVPLSSTPLSFKYQYALVGCSAGKGTRATGQEVLRQSAAALATQGPPSGPILWLSRGLVLQSTSQTA